MHLDKNKGNHIVFHKGTWCHIRRRWPMYKKVTKNCGYFCPIPPANGVVQYGCHEDQWAMPILNQGGLSKTLVSSWIQELLYFHLWIKSTSFNVWVRYVMWNFKGTLWNSTQNILPIHWKMWFLYNIYILRSLGFESSYTFLLSTVLPYSYEHYCDVIMSAMTSPITGVSIIITTVCSGADKKNPSKLCVTGLSEGNLPVTREFPAQKASNVENVSIWWCHHEFCVMWEGQTLPHVTKFYDCRSKTVDRKGFTCWSLI